MNLYLSFTSFSFVPGKNQAVLSSSIHQYNSMEKNDSAQSIDVDAESPLLLHGARSNSASCNNAREEIFNELDSDDDDYHYSDDDESYVNNIHGSMADDDESRVKDVDCVQNVDDECCTKEECNVDTVSSGPTIESLDYDPIHSIVYAKTAKKPQKRKIYGYSGITFTKWIITILIGSLVGCIAYCVSYFQGLIIDYKRTWTQSMIEHGLWISFIGYAGFSIMLVTLSSCLVLFWAPAASGGGVTLVMAYLNGNEVPDLLGVRTLVTKILGTICTISSGLPIGQEGPMVHVGAAVASTLTWLHCGFDSFKKHASASSTGCFGNPLPFDIYNDKDRREFISAGAAAGLAAAFGAPVGGVLYSLEEASSFWSRKVMWRSLVCTTVAALMLSWLSQRTFSFSLPGTLSLKGLEANFSIYDLPLFIITSIGAGFLGALVNISHRWLGWIRPSASHRLARILEACILTLLCVSVIFTLPLFFGHCQELPEDYSDTDFWFTYNCEQGSEGKVYNDLATLFFSVPHETITHLLQLGSSTETYFTVRSLSIYACSFFLQFILSYGVATPGGIFMPSMMVGASFGSLVGTIFKNIFPTANIQPGLHALIGATSMLGGLFRSTISLVVIVVEGTGNIEFLIPIILAIVISNWISHHIHAVGAYEADLESLGSIHFLHSEPPHELISLKAVDIMASNVIGFPEIVPVSEVVKVLQSNQHNGFPVFRCSADKKTARKGNLVGLILRHQLLVQLEQRSFLQVIPNVLNDYNLMRQVHLGKKTLQELQILENKMRVYHYSHNPHHRGLSSLPEAVKKLRLDGIGELQNTENLKRSDTIKRIDALDLRPFMNRAPLTVRGECSAQRVYVIFRTLGLRHLCVVDASNKVIGMITRKDIARAYKEAKLLNKRSLIVSDYSIASFYDKDERKSLQVLYSLP